MHHPPKHRAWSPMMLTWNLSVCHRFLALYMDLGCPHHLHHPFLVTLAYPACEANSTIGTKTAIGHALHALHASWLDLASDASPPYWCAACSHLQRGPATGPIRHPALAAKVSHNIIHSATVAVCHGVTPTCSHHVHSSSPLHCMQKSSVAHIPTSAQHSTVQYTYICACTPAMG